MQRHSHDVVVCKYWLGSTTCQQHPGKKHIGSPPVNHACSELDSAVSGIFKC